MSAVLEEVPPITDGGGDLASLVIAYHRTAHAGEPEACNEKMCNTAHDCIELDSMFYGPGV